MPRKIFPIQSLSVSSAGNAYLPIGARLHSIRGESDTKDTYDFLVTHAMWDGAAVVSYNCKYAGTRNGAVVNLWTEFPFLATVTAAPSTSDDEAINIQAGTNVVLQVYYVSGTLPQ